MNKTVSTPAGLTQREKMRRYIERTEAEFPKTYHMSMGELEALRSMDIYDALSLAFEYGRAKGFRYSGNKQE